MSRRRRADGPTLSLLAFQDIITSVTAILLLVTLMLAMELTRPSGAVASATADARLVRELQASIDRLREERNNLRASLDSSASQIEAQSNIHPIQIERQIGEAELALARQLRSNEAHEQARARAELERQRAEASRFDRADDARKLEDLDAEIAQLQAEAERAVRMVGRLSDRTGWRVELTGTAIQVQPMKLQEPPPTFPQAPSAPAKPELDPTSAAFLEWFRDAAHRSQYLLFVVRPSGITRFLAIREAIDEQGARYGYEAIGEEQLLDDPDEE